MTQILSKKKLQPCQEHGFSFFLTGFVSFFFHSDFFFAQKGHVRLWIFATRLQNFPLDTDTRWRVPRLILTVVFWSVLRILYCMKGNFVSLIDSISPVHAAYIYILIRWLEVKVTSSLKKVIEEIKIKVEILNISSTLEHFSSIRKIDYVENILKVHKMMNKK